MSMIANISITTLINGGIYALLAIGFSLVFGIGRILNLSHTAFYMLAAFANFYLISTLGVHPALAVLLSILITTLVGVFVLKIIIESVREHETAVLVLSIAVAMVLQEIMFLVFGGKHRGVPPLIEGYTSVAGVRVSWQSILSFGIMLIVLAAIWLLLNKTRLGISLRSSALDGEVANLMGINVGKTTTVAMILAVSLAAIAGAVASPLYTVEPLMWMHPLTIVMAVVIVGGLGSIKGSFIAAFILAFAEVLVVSLFPVFSFLRGALSLFIMLIILMVKPEGMFGIHFEGER